MKTRMIAVTLAALGLSASVAAQDKRSIFFVVSGGLTYGGDKVVPAHGSTYDDHDLRAGGLVQLGVGVLWRIPHQPFSVQATVNEHVDLNSFPMNYGGDFVRTPIELLAFYNGVPKWRFGGGLRWSLNPRARGYDAFADEEINQEIKFKDAVGGVIEGGYKVGRAAWINGRYVVEQYKVESYKLDGQTHPGRRTLNGSHFGVNVTWGF